MSGVAVYRLLPADSPLQVMGRAVMLLGVLGMGCAALALLRPADARHRWAALWEAGVLVFVALDLFWAFRGLNPTVPADFFAPHQVAADAPMLFMPQALEQRLKFEEFFTFQDYRPAVERWQEIRTALLPNLNLIDRQPMLNNFDPLVTQAYVEALGAVEVNVGDGAITALAAGDYVAQEPFGGEAFAAGALVSAVSLAGCLALLYGGVRQHLRAR